MGIGILNYTTKISTEKTVGEIQQMLAKIKAKAILTEYDDDAVLCALSFRISTPTGIMSFKLPANIEGVLKSLEERQTRMPKTREQAAKVAWRIIKDWVEAQLALVEAEIADIREVFLPYAQGLDGVTVYEALEKKKFKELTYKEGT